MRFWDRDEWKKWKEGKEGRWPPGHAPEDRPADYPKDPLPEGTPPEPIRWGEEIGDEKALPSKEELDDEKGDCKCDLPTVYGSTMRPRGSKGEYPRPGLGVIQCDVGKQVTMRYQARCVDKDYGSSKRTPGKCVDLTCNAFLTWICKAVAKSRRNPFGTEWVTSDATKSFVFSKCKEKKR